MNRIDSNTLGHLSQGMGGASSQGSAAGRFKGERLVAKDALSVLANAAEEISLHLSEKVEKKRHEERKVEGDSHAQLMQIEEITTYLDAVKAFDDPEKLAKLLQQMLDGKQNPRELARQQSQDPTQQFVLLQYALRQATANNSAAEILEQLQDALDDLEAYYGPQIRAGLNTAGVASEWGATASQIALFQGTYRDVVLGNHSFAQTLKLIMEKLAAQSGEEFVQGLKSLITAMGADLSAARPSVDMNRLHTLMQDLYQLQVVHKGYEDASSLSQTLQSRHGFDRLKPLDLLKELINLTGEKWVMASRFDSMAGRWSITAVHPLITFLMGAKELLRDLPVKVFPDADLRRAILDAAQEALDKAIEREDDEEELAMNKVQRKDDGAQKGGS